MITVLPSGFSIYRWFSQLETSICLRDFPWRTVSHNQRVNPVNHPFQTPKLPRSSLKISLYILHGLSCRHFSWFNWFNHQLYPYVYMRFLAYPMKYPWTHVIYVYIKHPLHIHHDIHQISIIYHHYHIQYIIIYPFYPLYIIIIYHYHIQYIHYISLLISFYPIIILS